MKSQRRNLLTMVAFAALGSIPYPTGSTVFAETEVNNDFSQADILSPHDGSILVTGSYQGPNASGFIDADFFTFPVSAGDIFRVDITPSSVFGQLSTFLYFPDQTFTGVAQFANHPAFTYPAPVHGNYYISVSGITAGVTGTYALAIDGLTAVPEPPVAVLVAIGAAGLCGAVGYSRRGEVRGARSAARRASDRARCQSDCGAIDLSLAVAVI